MSIGDRLQRVGYSFVCGDTSLGNIHDSVRWNGDLSVERRNKRKQGLVLCVTNHFAIGEISIHILQFLLGAKKHF